MTATYFAPGERATEKELTEQIETVSKNSLVWGLLNSI